jgi:hypothetical protein
VTGTSVRPLAPLISLTRRRAEVLTRIHAAREASVSIGVRLAADLEAAEKTRRSIVAGLRVLKTSAVAAGVIWGFNTATNKKGARRVFAIILSLLSAARALRKLGTPGISPKSTTHVARSTG